MKKRKTGFTLIEMMIVVAIIGILAGVLINVININRIQARSRNSRRMGDVKRIQTALELYFSNNRGYPTSANWVDVLTATESLSVYLIPDFISSMPEDPKQGEDATPITCFTTPSSKYGYYYRSRSEGKYILGATLEVDSAPDGNRCSSSTDIPNCTDSGYGCPVTPQCYCVQNPL